jgi:transaldolase
LLDNLERRGISYGDVTATLEREGVEKFVKSWEELQRTVQDELAHQPTGGAEESGQ